VFLVHVYFCSVGLGLLSIFVVISAVMATLCNRAGHYIFALWFLSSIFFPWLMCAVGDWMCTILPHMVWP